MRPASAKAKGRRLQQQVAADLRAAFSLPDDDVRSCAMGGNGEDVQLSDAARARVPWSIECKNQERLNLWAAFDQAEANARGHVPAVIAKRNHREPLCTLRWRDALALLVRAQGGGGGTSAHQPSGEAGVSGAETAPAAQEPAAHKPTAHEAAEAGLGGAAEAVPAASPPTLDAAPAFLRALADRLEQRDAARGE